MMMMNVVICILGWYSVVQVHLYVYVYCGMYFGYSNTRPAGYHDILSWLQMDISGCAVLIHNIYVAIFLDRPEYFHNSAAEGDDQSDCGRTVRISCI